MSDINNLEYLNDLSEDLEESTVTKDANERTPYVDIELATGDITQIVADAVVNAAHSDLTGGGGVDGAIHHASGQKLLGECLSLYGCPEGEARITGAYNMPAKYIIHTVCPVYSGKGRETSNEILANCYNSCLKMAEMQGLKSIAFPCMATGAGCFPKELASKTAVSSIRNFFYYRGFTYLDSVYIVCSDSPNFQEYNKLLR